MTLHIRPATAADSATIASLARELARHQGEPSENFTAQAARENGYGAKPEFSVLLAELDGAVVGYALYHDSYYPPFAARGVYLCDLHVTASARRRGAGRALVAAVTKEVKARGRTFLWWAVKPWNVAAREFYRSLGAIEEPVIAFALIQDAFERLAAEEGPAEPAAHG